MAKMDVRSGRIGTILDAQAAPFGGRLFELLLQFVARKEIDRTRRKEIELFFNVHITDPAIGSCPSEKARI
jgi:hypothetical protein